MTQQRDVVVVGGGPVGLSLVLGPARRGHDVLVLEKDAGTAEHSRAPVIWPGTQEILARLNVIDSFLAEGIVLPKFQLWDADHEKALISLSLEELAKESSYPQMLVQPVEKHPLGGVQVRQIQSETVRGSAQAVAYFNGLLSRRPKPSRAMAVARVGASPPELAARSTCRSPEERRCDLARERCERG
jgi:hypothetical protein